MMSLSSQYGASFVAILKYFCIVIRGKYCSIQSISVTMYSYKRSSKEDSIAACFICEFIITELVKR